MPGRSPIRALASVAVLALAVLAGCGGGEEEPGPLAGRRLAVYVSAPLGGLEGAVANDVVRGAQLALREAGERAGRYRVRLLARDSASPTSGRWDPSRVFRNAREAARDETTIAYLGELDAGSSAVSIPILNAAGILQVSPLDSALELTTHSAVVAGSPERYYPKAQEVGRTFARVVPSDAAQAQALLRAMERRGLARLAVLTDGDATEHALATALQAQARPYGVYTVVAEQIDATSRNQRDVVRYVRESEPQAVLYAGAPHEGAALLWEALAEALPEVPVFVPGSVAQPHFVERVAAVPLVTEVTRPVLPLDAYPPAARRFARAFERAYGSVPAPEALHGYEAMRTVLAAIRAAARAEGGAVTRAAVVRAYLRGDTHDGVLGRYAIESDGDATLARFGLYRLERGRLRYVDVLRG